MFKVGDRVKVIDLACWKNEITLGGIYTIQRQGTWKGYGCREALWVKTDNKKEGLEDGMVWFYHRQVKLIEGTMSKYQDLKERISRITAWDKGADDILQEITAHMGKWYGILPYPLSSGAVEVVNNSREAKASFNYSSQCEKLEAFKKALMWLLENSDIKKKDNSGEISDIKKEIERLNDRVKELE